MEYSAENQPESPLRISKSLEILKKTPFLNFIELRTAEEKEIELAHSKAYIEGIKNLSFPDDEECPKYPDLFYYASLSAGAALTALKNSMDGENSFSLMRPPGHHAASKPSGFCYFNNAAITALKARAEGYSRVAVLDIDYHHGNGTQEILLGKEGILHVDIHETRGWPGTGKIDNLNCLNFLVDKNSDEQIYLKTLEKALDDVRKFNPELIIVSAGFDTYKDDPVGGLGLEVASYRKIGKAIDSLAREIETPVCSLLEGGYSDKLAECIQSYLSGFDYSEDG
jgi:acetoin utilization deacetylase AcuC-like enzyme